MLSLLAFASRHLQTSKGSASSSTSAAMTPPAWPRDTTRPCRTPHAAYLLRRRPTRYELHPRRIPRAAFAFASLILSLYLQDSRRRTTARQHRQRPNHHLRIHSPFSTLEPRGLFVGRRVHCTLDIGVLEVVLHHPPSTNNFVILHLAYVWPACVPYLDVIA
jgi:hypothetical protein